MLRQRADREMLDDFERALVDHVDRAAVAVRDVDVRPCVPYRRAEVPDPVGCVDVLDHLLRDAGGMRRRDELGQRSRPCSEASAAAGEQDPARVGDGGEVGKRLAERADDADGSLQLDRRRRSGRSAFRPKRRGRRSRTPSYRWQQRPRASSAPGGGRSVTTLRVAGRNAYTASLAVPFSSEPPAITTRPRGGRHRGVAQRVREMRDDARGAARAPGDDRVEPARAAGVATDDVRRAADDRCGLVRASRGQMTDCLRGAGRRVDHHDRVELRRRRAATEQIGTAADL